MTTDEEAVARRLAEITGHDLPRPRERVLLYGLKFLLHEM